MRRGRGYRAPKLETLRRGAVNLRVAASGRTYVKVTDFFGALAVEIGFLVDEGGTAPPVEIPVIGLTPDGARAIVAKLNEAIAQAAPVEARACPHVANPHGDIICTCDEAGG